MFLESTNIEPNQTENDLQKLSDKSNCLDNIDKNVKNEPVKTEPPTNVTTNAQKKVPKTGSPIKGKRKKGNQKTKTVSKIKQKLEEKKEKTIKPKIAKQTKEQKTEQLKGIAEVKKDKPVKPKFVKLTEEQKRERRQEQLKGICPTCGIFANNVSEHIKRKHTETKQVNESVECDYCHRILSDKKYLRKHFKSHFQVR